MFAVMDTSPLASRSASPISLRWQWSRLPALAVADLYAALAARQQVFAVEQRCAFQDADGYDFAAWHLLGWTTVERPPQLAAYLRVLDPGSKYAESSIGRVLIVPPWRGAGLGRVLMEKGLEHCGAIWPGQAIRIAAQQRLQVFYESLGFRPVTAPYIEDDITHVDMVRAGR
jgi:ElaA protein